MIWQISNKYDNFDQHTCCSFAINPNNFDLKQCSEWKIVSNLLYWNCRSRSKPENTKQTKETTILDKFVQVHVELTLNYSYKANAYFGDACISTITLLNHLNTDSRISENIKRKRRNEETNKQHYNMAK